MSELLLELFSEEIPARMQRGAAEALKNGLKAAFEKAGWQEEGEILVETFVGPRRLIAYADGLPRDLSAIKQVEKRGPKLGAPQGAIDGFCKSAGITNAQLEERDGYYFAVIQSQGRDIRIELKEIIEKILNSFPWPKSMRWGAYPEQWVRPLQSILCLLDSEVVDVQFGHIKASNTTKGHRFLSDNQPIVINSSSWNTYFAKLYEAKVLINQDERKLKIESEISAEAAKHGLTVKPDAGLLDEVTGLVEWPVVLIGDFEERYLALPQEVPTTVMRAHQKYFALQNGDKLANKFAVVSNMVASDGGKVVTSGNERVLRARLSDGQFFYDQDLKTPLAEWNNGLSDMVFHAKIGSVAEKVKRIKALAAKLIAFVPGADAADVARAAELCKADLTTGMVGEFPELQGLMGRYYATAQGEKPAVADAIRDHYSPLGPTDDCPTAPVSVTIALADKLDTLVSMFAIGEKPTGSKDPFALRRAALGVIRLILENGLRLPLQQFVSAELLEFFITRLKVSLKEEGITHDRIDAVLKSGFNGDLTQLVARVRALDTFLKTTDGTNLLAGAKRALNILKAAKSHAAANVDAALLEAAEEKALATATADVSAKVDASLAKEDFAGAMQAISSLRTTIDAFFEKVIVNADDEKVRANRLALLQSLAGVFAKVADFSLIEG